MLCTLLRCHQGPARCVVGPPAPRMTTAARAHARTWAHPGSTGRRPCAHRAGGWARSCLASHLGEGTSRGQSDHRRENHQSNLLHFERPIPIRKVHKISLWHCGVCALAQRVQGGGRPMDRGMRVTRADRRGGAGLLACCNVINQRSRAL